MENTNTRDSQTDKFLLHEALSVLASNTDPVLGIETLLDTTLKIAGADRACIIIFRDPELYISSDDEVPDEMLPDIATLNEIAASMTPEIHVDPSVTLNGERMTFVGQILSPIHIEQKPEALFWCLKRDDNVSAFSEEHIALLRSLKHAIASLCRSLKANEHHQKLETNQSEFISIVSHDLRSPLTSMKGFADMLESGSVGELNDQQAYFIEKILAGISQMTSLVDNIQDAGRYDPETGFYKMQRAQCDLTEMVARIVNSHLVPAEKQALTMRTSISDNVPIINIDTHMIERAIINLVDNAIKYTPNGAEVEVGVKRIDDTVIISVRDSGLGISPENQTNLFERRVRIAREEHKRIKGSGLGLFIVRSAARRHSGDAWIESQPGEGSTFFISIPLTGDNLLHSG